MSHKCKDLSSNPNNPHEAKYGRASLQSQCSSFAKMEGRKRGILGRLEARECMQCQTKERKERPCLKEDESQN